MGDSSLKLVIVESPAKARTLSKFLGAGYSVRASMGHVRDLPVSEFGVDVEAGFRPRYTIVRGKTRTVKELEAEASRAEQVLLATDPDREGEAISWHLAELLGIPSDQPCRIEFHEITRRAVEQALRKPRAIDHNLVNAQQARRILDRIVGYRLSPLLWKKVQRGLSAGRVQSAALRLICEREDEIEAFVVREYWTIDAILQPAASDGRLGEEEGVFRARLVAVDGQEPSIGTEQEARALADELRAQQPVVVSVTSTRRQRRPPAPFTTSTLQQEASRRLGFTARRTMQIAQQLYEGLDVGEEGPVGLITYMRTDSVNVAREAQEAARQFIEQRFGREFVPEHPNVYKSRKGAQEAHEAIRPTSVERTPESLKPYLKPEQWRLYELIWRRFVASQMVPAQVESTTVVVRAGRFELKATGSVILEPGFLVVWGPERRATSTAGDSAPAQDGRAESGEGADGSDEDEARQALPALTEGQPLVMKDAVPEQHFTQPPPRYNDASLVKTMEELGIGRPSTYAPTIETLLERRYVRREGQRLVPTPLGRAVVKLLKEQFPDVVDVEFTAQMEARLDAVEAGEVSWQDVVAQFYHPFERRVEEAMRNLERVTIEAEPSDEVCEQCGRPMVVKWGRYGRFLACSGYPECKHTRPLLRKTGANCPVCGGELVERHTRRGRTFYGCVNYPKCTYTLWHRPVGRACPSCGRPLVNQRARGGQRVVCAGTLEKGPDGQALCDYVEEGVASTQVPPSDGAAREPAAVTSRAGARRRAAKEAPSHDGQA